MKEARTLLSLSDADATSLLVAKFLALRNPRRVAAARERFASLGLDVSWEEVDRELEALREAARRGRAVRQAEAEARNRAWLDRFEDFLEREVAGRGLEWELFDWMRIGGARYVVKLGVWPWGATFLEGTLDELCESVREIVTEVLGARWQCPFCGADLDWRAVTELGRCGCGARFTVSRTRALDGSLHENDAWERLEERLRQDCPDWRVYAALLEAGVHVEELFEGVAYLGRVFGWPAYSVRGRLARRPLEEVGRSGFNALRVALCGRAFAPLVERCGGERLEWWAGSLDGVGVKVCPEHPEGLAVAVVVDVRAVPVRCGWGDLDLEVSDAVLEGWSAWLVGNGAAGEYEVRDWITVSEHEVGEGFVWRPSPERVVLMSGEDWLEGLRAGLGVYCRKVEEYAAGLGLG